MISGSDNIAVCPICKGTKDIALLWEANAIPILRCGECTHQFAEFAPADNHTNHTYGDDYFHSTERGAPGYPDYLSGEHRVFERGTFYGRILENFTSPGRLMDVGCGPGFLMEGLASHGWQVTGIEPNVTMAGIGAARGNSITVGAFESADIPKQSLDLVVMVQVVAHLTDPREAIQSAHRILKKGGLLLIETWDADSKAARLLKSHWHEYVPPTVLHLFTRKSIRKLAGSSGFKPVASRLTTKTINADHAASILRKTGGKSTLMNVAAKLLSVLPPALALPYPTDDLFWSLFYKPVSQTTT